MKPGLYWARTFEGKYDKKTKSVIQTDKKLPWELVEVRETTYREEGVEIFIMGWDSSFSIAGYTDFVEVILYDPDGKPYEGN